jgi:hypothetical protein
MIRIGIIGLSEGNGHPYSWSAIINGDYDEAAMADCGYAGIPLYLNANRATLGIDGARVTHIWTQDKALSEHVAKASRIEKAVDRLEDLIGQVDAVLLARDDPENHREMAKPFIEAGIPIFIDKPLACNKEDLDYFTGHVEQGEFIMSCSSMRYASEVFAVKQNMQSLGRLELVSATGKKDWIKYGVHMLEGMFALLDDPRVESVKHVSEKSGRDIVYIEFETGLLATVNLFKNITPVFQMTLFGEDDWKLIEYENYYVMFRDNLVEFIRSVKQGSPRLSFEKTQNIIKTLIAANESLNGGGKTIYLK